jgi:hypothetical protein
MQATEAYTESEQRLALRLELRNDDHNDTEKFVIKLISRRKENEN